MENSPPDDDLRYLRHILEVTGLKAGGLASRVGVAGSTFTRRLNADGYKFVLSMPTIRKIEEFSGISYAQFVAGGTDAATVPARATPAMPSSVSIVPGTDLVSARKMPVYAAAMGGTGHIIVSFDQIDEVKRPAELENVKGGYGLLVKGTSMVPAFREGDMALVNPHLPPARERNVILYHTPPNGGDVEAMIKELQGWSDREWHLKQWNPVEEFKEFRAEWPVCHRVVGKYDGR